MIFGPPFSGERCKYIVGVCVKLVARLEQFQHLQPPGLIFMIDLSCSLTSFSKNAVAASRGELGWNENNSEGAVQSNEIGASAPITRTS